MSDEENYLTDGDDNDLDEGLVIDDVDEGEAELERSLRRGNSNSEDEEDGEDKPAAKVDASMYGGRITVNEIKLSTAYDCIVASRKDEDADGVISLAIYNLINASPLHTNQQTIESISREILNSQGHNRMKNSVYSPDSGLKGSDLNEDYFGTGDSGFNESYSEELKELIERFIDYLAKRDLSKDSVSSRKQKLRHIPAFIIMLFNSGTYDFITNCSTMPPVYQKQIDHALKMLKQSKYDIVEELARRYEEKGRPLVAERVRQKQLSWFDYEPAVIIDRYPDLNLTVDDVITYREYRSRFTNTSKAITQDVISEYIEVCEDKASGSYYKLKDKTRKMAIIDVRKVWTDWCKENAGNTELAKKLIWND